MSATQEDVAALAGVARKTVSNVINGYPHISDDVRARVLTAIEELGYRPNHVARSLRSGRSRVIGLVVPELDVSYFAELARLIVIKANEQGMTVMIVQTLGDRAREIDAIAGTNAPFVEGVIYSPVALAGGDVNRHRGPSPLVLLGERSHEGLVDHVGIDNVAASRQATEHLVGLGCRRIAFVGASDRPESEIARLREEGYRQALTQAGIPILPELILQTDAYHRKNGVEAMQIFLSAAGDRRRPVDAVFCATDLLAQGVIRALRDARISVPQDVAVVGFDDIDEGLYSIPRLTSVSPDKDEIATTAVRRIIERIDGSAPAARETTTSFTLRVRESSAGWRPLAPVLRKSKAAASR